MGNRLKPCPFCGANAATHEYVPMCGPSLYKVGCNSKRCREHIGPQQNASADSGWRKTKREAVEDWNRRARAVIE